MEKSQRDQEEEQERNKVKKIEQKLKTIQKKGVTDVPEVDCSEMTSQ